MHKVAFTSILSMIIQAIKTGEMFNDYRPTSGVSHFASLKLFRLHRQIFLFRFELQNLFQNVSLFLICHWNRQRFFCLQKTCSSGRVNWLHKCFNCFLALRFIVLRTAFKLSICAILCGESSVLIAVFTVIEQDSFFYKSFSLRLNGIKSISLSALLWKSTCIV